MNTKINLFFLPFAGGSSYSYANFNSQLASFINPFPIELPGRGRRMSESLLNDALEVTEDVFNQIKNTVSENEKYAIYGHSMGGLLSYLLSHKLSENSYPLPLHLFVSGRGGPSYKDERELYHLLPKKEFKDKLIELGGSPKEVLEHDGLMDFFEPILRADFKIVETYQHIERNKLSIPINVMIGDDDKISLEAAKLWENETLSNVKIRNYDGGHFFIFNHLNDICANINAELSKY